MAEKKLPRISSQVSAAIQPNARQPALRGLYTGKCPPSSGGGEYQPCHLGKNMKTGRKKGRNYKKTRKKVKKKEERGQEKEKIGSKGVK
jgi:hypothetical protein